MSSQTKQQHVSSNQGRDIGSKHIMSSLKALYTHIHQRRVKLIKQTHACTYECMTHLTYLVATQHQWQYA